PRAILRITDKTSLHLIWNPMISNSLAAALARRNIHYGWVMVGVTFFAALISAGTVGAPGVFIVPLQNEFGWSTA
ncbi:hypothetical protein, partial [Serratia marcescens]|uniref:hypothetical protein n=1 Tax=Serratia marcescens TaxID=615 RepID=UPI003F6887F5